MLVSVSVDEVVQGRVASGIAAGEAAHRNPVVGEGACSAGLRVAQGVVARKMGVMADPFFRPDKCGNRPTRLALDAVAASR
jgi:hypothetical protein